MKMVSDYYEDINEFINEYSEPTVVVEINVVLKKQWIKRSELVEKIVREADRYIELQSKIYDFRRDIYNKLLKNETIDATEIFNTAYEFIENLEVIESLVRHATNNFEDVPNENVAEFYHFLKREKKKLFDDLYTIYVDSLVAQTRKIQQEGI